MFKTLLGLFGAPFLLLALLVAPASAQSVTINLAPAMEYLMPIIVALVTAAVGWLAELMRRKFNLDIEARHREALQTALLNGASLLLQKAGGKVGTLSINVGNEKLANIAQIVADSVPDAMKAFGLTPQAIQEKILAKLAQVPTPAVVQNPVVTISETTPKPQVP